MLRSLSLRYLLFTTLRIPKVRDFSPRAESATFLFATMCPSHSDISENSSNVWTTNCGSKSYLSNLSKRSPNLVLTPLQKYSKRRSEMFFGFRKSSFGEHIISFDPSTMNREGMTRRRTYNNDYDDDDLNPSLVRCFTCKLFSVECLSLSLAFPMRRSSCSQITRLHDDTRATCNYWICDFVI
jgi:hypothetical protein